MIRSQSLNLQSQFNSLECLTDSELSLLASVSNYKKCQRGKFIYEEGQRKNYVYLLDKGSIKIGSNTKDGKTIIKEIVHEKSFFGENIFAGEEERTEHAQSINDSNYYEIPIEYFRKLTMDNPDFAQYILELIIQKLHALEERMQNFVFKSARARIVNFIKSTGELKGIKIGIEEVLINHGMSHKEIAFLTDTSRQTVARVLGELKKSNLIHFSARKPNKILIRNIEALSLGN